MATIKDIKQAIINAIKQSKMTQTELARAINVSASTISKYVHGKSMPTLHNFFKLCKVLDLFSLPILNEPIQKNSKTKNKQK